MIRVILAEDHFALIEGIKLYFEFDNDIKIIGYAKNGKELIELAHKTKPDIIITDIKMPIVDGLTATREISKSLPNTSVITFTMYNQEKVVNEMFEAGVQAYVLKNSSLEKLKEAIIIVHNNGTYYDPNIIQPNKQPRDSILTKRQLEILRLLVEGKTNQQIANLLYIQKSTVETHRKNMARKLKLSGQNELLRYGLQQRYKY
ncbi:response regulator [Winogradskyella sp. 3972H.M.0a.05]|uniref:response regulator n=1 Tax=Winogradskyella sp. 3972H.M.0a.05 TaxID=2950277 RepID=UPI003391F5BD